MKSDPATRQERRFRTRSPNAAAKLSPAKRTAFRVPVLRSSRLGALLYPEETLKELDMGARGRLQREVRT